MGTSTQGYFKAFFYRITEVLQKDREYIIKQKNAAPIIRGGILYAFAIPTTEHPAFS